MAVAIVLAAGSGSRMNSDIAKQYLKIKDKEVLYYSLKVFEDNNNIDAIILVTRKEDIAYCQENIVDKYGFNKVKNICEGGSERYYSVYNGLMCAGALPDEQRDIVMIHDGARPFVNDVMIQDSIDAIKERCSACTVGMPVKDTIKVVREINGERIGVETPDRSTLYQIQTPQTFRYDMLMSAYENMFRNKNGNITDDTMIAEQYAGVLSVVVPGSYENIKITTPEDLEVAEKFLEKNLKKF